MKENVLMVDGLQMNKQNPTSFYVPSQKEKEDVSRFDHVKIGFLTAKGISERMWVAVRERFEDGTLSGFLDNDPVICPHLECGDLIKFSMDNIINIIPSNATNAVLSYEKEYKPKITH